MQSSEQSLALMNIQCLYMELPVHLNFPEGISGMEVARNLASSLSGKQRAIGAPDRELLHGRGAVGETQDGKKEVEVATEALTVTQVQDFSMSQRGEVRQRLPTCSRFLFCIFF